MNPLAIHAENYRTFERLDLDLPAGCVAIVGGNGAGKSSTVNVIDIALFGPESRSLADALTSDTAGTELVLELVFEHGGETYRVRRGYSARGAGKTTLDLETGVTLGAVENGQEVAVVEWSPLTRESVKSTQAAIEELLGLSRDTFRASTFLKQRDGAAFTDAQPKDRKRILAEILGLDRWDAFADLARTDRRRAEQEVEEIRGRLRLAAALTETKDADTADHAAAVRDEHDATARLAAAEQRLELATAAYQAAKERADAVAAADAELRAASESLARLNDQVEHATLAANQIPTIDADIARLEQVAATLDEAEKAKADLDRWQHERATWKRERDGLVKQATEREYARLDRLGDASGLTEKAAGLRAQADEVLAHIGDHECDRCGQALGADAAARAAASYRADADRLDQQAGEVDVWAAAEQTAIAELRARAEVIVVDDILDEDGEAAVVGALHAARQAVTRVASLRERRGMLAEQAAAATPELHARLADARQAATAAGAAADAARAAAPAVGELEQIIGDGKTARFDVEQIRQQLAQAQQARARLRERLDRIAETEQMIGVSRAREAELLDEIQVAAALERAYGRDGIPALIVENTAIPQIETEANRVLSELPCGDGSVFRVELQTQRANKTGDGVRDVLDIVVHAAGGERAYETFSEGEKTRLNMALRIALASLLATRRGADSRCLIVDEPEFLDEQGTQALAQVLRDLVNRGTFDRVFLVSHVPALRDSFDQTIEIVKEAGRSRIVADVAERVLA